MLKTNSVCKNGCCTVQRGGRTIVDHSFSSREVTIWFSKNHCIIWIFLIDEIFTFYQDKNICVTLLKELRNFLHVCWEEYKYSIYWCWEDLNLKYNYLVKLINNQFLEIDKYLFEHNHRNDCCNACFVHYL